ncbi:MAG: methyltransferase domain-containing protein [Nitrospirae bacterium]|nr:MAG: methyltransferase domain-containing protein [Nitrospirota bacterium]
MVLAVAAVPPEAVLRRAVAGEAGEVVALEESLTATVIVRRVRDARGTWTSLELNGVNVAGTSPELLAIQQLQGHLPLLQHPRPRRVLHIGLGTGATCWAVSRHPVERIDVVEIAPEVVGAADRYFRHLNHGVLHDPRVRVILNDGRNYLLATDERYDAILSDSIHPVYAGNGTLYTEEYFRLCRDHLRPGGVVSMWLPMYSLTRESFLRILSAFRRVFPRAAVWYDVSVPNEFTVVTGRAEPGPLELRWGALAEPALAPSLAVARVGGPEDLAARLALGPKEVAALTADVPPESDDLPYVEYVSGRVLDRERSWLENFLLLIAFRARVDPFERPPFSWPEVAARRDRLLRAHGRAVKARLTASR